MKVLITGISGFVGSYLAEYALSQGAEVWGTVRWGEGTDNVKHLQGQIELQRCELADPGSTATVIEAAKADLIFHLAAQAFVPTSWDAPQHTLSNNILVTVNLFQAVSNYTPTARILNAGSSEEYGLVMDSENPVKETQPLRPLSPYAVSKVVQDLLGYQYHMSKHLYIVCTRAFNHTGPRQGEIYAIPSFAKQIAEIEKGLREPVITTGNLEVKRDFCDVRDIVRGYWLALEKGEAGEIYNLCSGRACELQTLLDMLLSFSKARIETRSEPSLARPSEHPDILGDCAKFHALTGWQPEIPIEQTLRDVLDFWRAKVGSDAQRG